MVVPLYGAILARMGLQKGWEACRNEKVGQTQQTTLDHPQDG